MTAAVPAIGPGLGAAFRRLFVAAVVTRFADTSRMAAFGVLAVTLTSDPRLVSAVAATNFIPWLLFGLVAGALADRWDKRRAFLTADLLRCLIVAVLVVVVATGHVTIAIILITAFLLTTLQTVSDSCFNSLLPMVVGKERLGQANARLSMAQSGVGQLAGGPAGSALFAWQPAAPFIGNVLCFLTAAFQVGRLPSGEEPVRSGAREREPLWRELTAGIRWIAATPLIMIFTATTAVMNFASGLYQGILPLYALRTLNMPVYAYGALAGTVAVAMIGGNWAAGRLMSRVPAASISRNAVVAQTVAFLIISVAPTGWVTFLGVAGFGFSAGMWNVPWMSILMAEAPAEVRGRVMAAYRTLVVSIYPIGALVSGFIASWFGNRAPFLLCAVCVGLAALHLTLNLRRSPHQAKASNAEG